MKDDQALQSLAGTLDRATRYSFMKWASCQMAGLRLRVNLKPPIGRMNSFRVILFESENSENRRLPRLCPLDYKD